jgi:hypothetical protein
MESGELKRLVESVNARDARVLDRVLGRLVDHSREIGTIRAFVGGMGLGPHSRHSMGIQISEPQVCRSGAKAFVSLLGAHPALAEGRRLEAVLPIFGPTDDDPAVFELRGEAAELLVLGALALGTDVGDIRNSIEGLVHVAMGPEAFSTVLRRLLIGRPIPEPGGREGIPASILRLRKDIERNCLVGVANALTDVSLAAQGAMPIAYATGIAALSPSVGCDGTIVTIEGTGFGPSQPQNVDVYFPTITGSCVPATVISWSDANIVVRAPSSVGPGCVGFVRRGSGGAALFKATNTLAGEMERCLGMAASAAAYRLRQAGVLGMITCPPCLPSKANFFSGGPPSIEYFSANGGFDVAAEPGDAITLSWRVTNASTVSLTRTSLAGPYTPPPAPLPTSSTHSMGAFTGLNPTTATYELTASNACGVVSRSVSVRLQKTPKLAVSAIEVVQVIQRPDNSVRLVEGKATAIRVFVDSGLTGGFDYGKGPDVMPRVVGRATAFPVGAGRGFDLGAPWAPASVDARPASNMNRDLQSHSLIFDLPANLAVGTVRIEVRAVVQDHEKDVGGPFVAFGATTVTFQARPAQEILPFLVADPLLGLPAPTLAQFFTSLRGAIVRFGISDSGFIVNPPQMYSTVRGPSIRPLTQALGWSLMLMDLATLIFVFPQSPVGGIRAGLVPTSATYAVNGMAVPRVAVSIPAMLAQNGLLGTFAHEMGHAIGLGHAACPPPCPGGNATPPDGIDGRLPGVTDATGMDMGTRTVIAAGRGEMMSYCGDTSRCPGPTRWPSTTSFDIVFDSLPI